MKYAKYYTAHSLCSALSSITLFSTFHICRSLSYHNTLLAELSLSALASLI